MESGLDNGLPELDDPDAQVNRSLRRFQNSTNHYAPTTSTRITPESPWDLDPETPETTKPSPFEIVPPTVDHPDEYEYLPGHFAVRRIFNIDSTNPQLPRYTVRLRSGELETVRPIRSSHSLALS